MPTKESALISTGYIYQSNPTEDQESFKDLKQMKTELRNNQSCLKYTLALAVTNHYFNLRISFKYLDRLKILSTLFAVNANLYLIIYPTFKNFFICYTKNR